MQVIPRMIGRALAAPGVLRVLRACVKPHVHLHNLSGEMYMGRWSVIDEFHREGMKDTDRRTRASKVLEFLTGYASIRLHWIRKPDAGRELHNHPFKYRTFVMKGRYFEEYADSENLIAGTRSYQFLPTGSTSTSDQIRLHRIAIVPEEGVWTLFCMTRNNNLWGFAVDGVFIRSGRYFLQQGYGKRHRSGGAINDNDMGL